MKSIENHASPLYDRYACPDVIERSVVLVIFISCRVLGETVTPLTGVGHARLELEPQALPRRVQPALDRAQGRFHFLGDVNERQATNVEGDQGVSVERLEPAQRLPEPFRAFPRD